MTPHKLLHARALIRAKMLTFRHSCAQSIRFASLFLCFPLVTCFRACYGLHVFPRLLLVSRFLALIVGFTFSCIWPRLLVYPSLRASYVYPCYGFHVFPRLLWVKRFSAFVPGFSFSHASYWFRVFPRLSLCSIFTRLLPAKVLVFPR